MNIHRQFRRLAAIPVLFITLGLTSTLPAHADDTHQVDALFEVPVDSLKLTYQEHPGRVAVRKLDRLKLPKPEPAIVSFAKDCASLDAIPLVELAKNDRRRLFIGINFDGVLGIHGQL